MEQQSLLEGQVVLVPAVPEPLDAGCARNAWEDLEIALDTVFQQAWPLSEPRSAKIERKLRKLHKLMGNDLRCQTPHVR